VWCLVSIALLATAGALPPADEAPRDDVASVEAQVVEKKLRLAQVYRFRGARDRALALVRQVQAIRPADEDAARLAVDLWEEGWDEQIVRCIEESPAKIKLAPLDELVDVKALGAALIATLEQRTDIVPYREAELIAPYVRPAHADALRTLLKNGDEAQRALAAGLLCLLNDPQGDAYVRSWLSALSDKERGGQGYLLAYASRETWQKLLAGSDSVAYAAAVNLGYSGEADVLKHVEPLVDRREMLSVEAGITALIKLGERKKAAEAVRDYRAAFWEGKSGTYVGHKLLLFYAALGDEKQFFEIFDALADEERSPLARQLAGRMHVAAGRREQAEALVKRDLDELEAKIVAEPEDADLRFQLASAIATAGTDPARAKAAALETLQHHVRSALRPRLYELLAGLYLKEGKLEQAAMLADAAVMLYSSDHPAYVALKRQVETARKAARETAPE
jgi:hypothetical protein